MRAWHLEPVDSADLAIDPLTVAFVRDQHLRAPNGSLEDDYIGRLIKTSLRMAQRITQRKLFTQQWECVTDAFPPACRELEIPLAPLQSIDAITYIDADGNEQTWGGSPLPYVVRNPTVESNRRAVLYPAFDVEWPTTRAARDAVTMLVTVGYPETGSPLVADVPDDITHGRLLVIGELYKQRSESVHAFNQNPAVLRARDLWMGYRVY